ncbi:hypothetical protein [Hymenobacter edaphi]|uniref:hypothetical protein n=1 Tax=Hymenobacter edaphi TaxID=2211146 RepID=UPI0010576D72|nr:hypothetical protein [Hymenobacter edaphi]
MKSLLLFALLLVCGIAKAQAPMPYDHRDPYGQYIGKTVDQIFEAMKTNASFRYGDHLLLAPKPGSLLFYVGANGMELSYLIIDGMATEVMISIPKGAPAADNMLKFVAANCQMMGSLPDGSATRYQSPYARIMVYEAPAYEDREDRLCFRYTPIPR